MRLLRNRLLEAAPKTTTCFPGLLEEDLSKILSRGFFQLGKHAKRMPGDPSQCHANAANLWEQNKERAAIVTGYALSKDGIWRQHTWLIDLHKSVGAEGARRMHGTFFQIVETTEPRVLYYGFRLTEDEAEQFAFENY